MYLDLKNSRSPQKSKYYKRAGKREEEDPSQFSSPEERGSEIKEVEKKVY